jgi:two-component system, NtrC family, response regulator HydG
VTRILVVEDQQTLREALVEVLGALGCRVEGVGTVARAKAAFEREPAGLVLTDLRLETAEGGLDVLRFVRGLSPRSEVLLMTAYGSIEIAVQAMRAGAFDFLEKPFSMVHLTEKVRRILAVLEERDLLDREREQASLLRSEIEEIHDEGRIVGRSGPMLDLLRQVDKVAESPSSVLILGESGTGKEVVARAIHRRSRRSGGPFIKVNCGALAEGLLESELFGHEKGAFTGAVRRNRGRFELADGGSILLDEIAEISAALQVKLLRVLQEHSFERVGGEETITVDVRVLAATNRDLRAEVAAGRFREDLFYRLFVIPLRVPALRERREDIPLLADYYLVRLGRQMGRPRVVLDDEALNLLRVYDWPGNVRELENVLARAIVLCENDCITPADLPFAALRGGSTVRAPAGFPPLRDSVEELERLMIMRAMESAGGVKTEAARLLDLKPSVLYYKLEKYGLMEPGPKDLELAEPGREESGPEEPDPAEPGRGD